MGLSKTLSVLLCSCVCVGVVPLGLGGGGSSQATRRTWFTVNIPSGDGSARKVVRAAPAAAVRRKQPLSSGNFPNDGGPGGGGWSQATGPQRELASMSFQSAINVFQFANSVSRVWCRILKNIDRILKNIEINVFQYAVNVFQCFSICGQCFSMFFNMRSMFFNMRYQTRLTLSPKS